MYTDTLSDAVDGLGIGGVVLSHTVIRGGGAVEIPDGLAGAMLHLVERGSLRLRFGDGPAATLAQGDVVLLPRVRAHVAGVSERPTRIDRVDGHRTASGAKLLDVGTGAGVQAEVFSAYFTYRIPGGSPVLDLLPERILVRTDQQDPDFGAVLGLLAGEMTRPRPGGRAVSGLLVGAALVGALRAVAQRAEAPGSDELGGAFGSARVAGLLGGLREPRLARALGAVSAAPGDTWSLDRLAAEATLSRSRFAALFREHVGVAPLEYVALWRVAQAQALLLEGRLPMSGVAERVGYGSDVAFSRAFRRVVGLPPGQWREQTSLLAQVEDHRPGASIHSWAAPVSGRDAPATTPPAGEWAGRG